MAKIKRQKNKKKESDSNLPPSVFYDRVEPAYDENNTAIKGYKGQQKVEIIFIPEKTLIVEESRFEKPTFWVQTSLAVIGLLTFIGFVVFSIIQHQDSVNNLKFAEQSYRAADSISKESYRSQRIKDSSTLKQTDSSLALTRQSSERADRGLRLTEKNIFLTTEISRTAIQPFLFADSVGEIQNLRTGEIPYNEYEITNVGATPAYKVNTWSIIMFESDFNQDTIDIYTFNKPETGWFIGSKKTTGTAKSYFYGGEAWKNEDAIAYITRKKPILFITVITYEDAFGKSHFTQQGRIRTIDKGWTELRKYARTDHDKQTKTNK
ncbi:MAG: hypothetical protein EHM64_16855 [Ignavibacteriae bacterium]|nr:MAG: hypothetical protein EHM64_16855 [Ignavibacteriota bacterium]